MSRSLMGELVSTQLMHERSRALVWIVSRICWPLASDSLMLSKSRWVRGIMSASALPSASAARAISESGGGVGWLVLGDGSPTIRPAWVRTGSGHSSFSGTPIATATAN